jgi:hypothetical protein
MDEDEVDDRLTAELGAAVRAAAEVPASFVEVGRRAFAWRNVDAELAALGYDTAAAPAAAGTRAERATLRALTFVASRLTIELEATEDALVGQLVPQQPGEVELQQAGGVRRTVAIDELGWFAFRGPAPSGMCRIRVRTEDGTTVLTEWMTI